MRVGINARLLSSRSMRGWNRYTINLLQELALLGVELVLYCHQQPDPAFTDRLSPDAYTIRISPAMPYLWWEERWLPQQCEADAVEVLHSPFNFGLPWSSPCPRVLTLHDAMYRRPNYLRILFRRRELETGLYHWIARSRAHRVITPTEFSKRELVNCLGVSPGRISVTHEGADPAFLVRPADSAIHLAARKHGLSAPYFFYAGGWEQYKNLPFLIDAFKEASIAGVDLVLGGGSPQQIEELSTSVTKQVRLLGWLSDEDLVPLYAGALAFVHPANHESFGLPLCEAMGVGCPVLAARAGAFPEVLGNGGETFSLDSSEELIGLMKQVAGDPCFRAELRERAALRSRDLSWRRTAEQTIAVYERAIAEYRQQKC